jgi:hypothetical protein
MSTEIVHNPDEANTGDVPQRDPDGRFALGNPGGPGPKTVGPRRRIKERITDADLDMCVEEMRNIVRDPKARPRDKINVIALFFQYAEIVKVASDIVREMAEVREAFEQLRLERA